MNLSMLSLDLVVSNKVQQRTDQGFVEEASRGSRPLFGGPDTARTRGEGLSSLFSASTEATSAMAQWLTTRRQKLYRAPSFPEPARTKKLSASAPPRRGSPFWLEGAAIHTWFRDKSASPTCPSLKAFKNKRRKATRSGTPTKRPTIFLCLANIASADPTKCLHLDSRAYRFQHEDGGLHTVQEMGNFCVGGFSGRCGEMWGDSVEDWVTGFLTELRCV